MGDGALRVRLEQTAPIPLDVAASCEPGQILAIFGPSGSGKTTILRSIAGLYTPRRGTVTIGDETWLDTAAGIDRPVHRRRVGFVFQEYALFPHLTALGNVVSALGDRPRGERRARARALLELVHLQDRADRRPHELSGGERQRVAVARAMAREPRVLLLDEPFAAIDRRLRRALHAEIEAISRAVDIPIVLVTHDFEDVVRLATHLAIVRSGCIVASGPLEMLTSRPEVPWLRETVGLGTVADADVVRIDSSRGLAELRTAGPVLYAPAAGLADGARVRLRIPAKEVILATGVPSGLSVHNVLEGTVTAVSVAPDANVATVQLAVGGLQLLAEVTTDAAERLRIREGATLHALIKSVSLDVQRTGGDAAGSGA